MSAQDILNNVQLIGGQGNFQVAPQLPKPKPITKPQVVTNTRLGPAIGMGLGESSSVGPSVLDRLMQAIRSQESGGNYRATNPSGASGGYQILRSNFEGRGGWDMDALGRDITYNQFINSPQLQDAIARYKLSKYLNKYGVSGAAAAWYGGPGAVSHIGSTTPQGEYPSINAYVQAILKRMR